MRSPRYRTGAICGGAAAEPDLTLATGDNWRSQFRFPRLREILGEVILEGVITLISGTNRPGSNTRKVARQVEEIYKELKVPLHVLDLTELPSEIFSPTSYAEKPTAFHPFADAILKSTGLVIVTPEYNGSVPGILKYFIDMLKFPESFERRPVCFVGLSAGIWGALRPIEQLQQIFGYRNAYIYPERVFLPQINSLLDASDRLKDTELVNRLKAQAEGFIGFVKHFSKP